MKHVLPKRKYSFVCVRGCGKTANGCGHTFVATGQATCPACGNYYVKNLSRGAKETSDECD